MECLWQKITKTKKFALHHQAQSDINAYTNIKKKNIAVNYQDKPLPMSEFYCEFRVKPARMVFYTYRTDQLSDMVKYYRNDGDARSIGS